MGRFIFFGEKKLQVSSKKMVSAYEQQRLDNIAQNNAVLDAFGLLGDNSLKPSGWHAASRPATQAARLPNDELRRSSRVAGSNVKYCELNDAWLGTLSVSLSPDSGLSRTSDDCPQHHPVGVTERRGDAHATSTQC